MRAVKRWLIRQTARRARPYVKAYGLLRTVKYKHALVAEPPGERIVVLAPHMDDEVIGCGGALCKYVRRGAAVTVVYVTDGRMGSKALARASGVQLQQGVAELVATRRREAELAMQDLGIRDGVFLDAEETTLLQHPELVYKLRDILRSRSPDVVYLPHFLEEHPDHRAMTALLAGAVAGTGISGLSFDCCGYEVWTPLFPNYLVDISDVVELKKQALAHYQSQLADTDYIHTAIGLNAYRSSALLETGGHAYAEAYLLAPLREYLDLYRCANQPS
jgi:N-acetylglucosamine malate deacetylase 1